MIEMQSSTIEQKNKEYFKSLVETRGSVGNLLVSWAGLGITLIHLVLAWWVVKETHVNPLENKFIIFLIVICVILSICLILPFIGNFIYKHQIFSSLLLTIFSIILTFLVTCLAYWFTVISSKNVLYDIRPITLLSKIYIISMICLWIASFIYNIFWLKKQLSRGFSEARTQKNYFARSSVYSSKSLWIIFGCSMLGGVVWKSTDKIIVFALGILFVTAFSRLTVEYAYASYLRIKDKDYWEELPPKPIYSKEEQRIRKFKWAKRINIIVCIIIIWIMYLLGTNDDLQSNQKLVALYIGRICLMDLGIILIIHIFRKIQGKLRSKK
jgi:hypothetical protein